MKRKGRTSTNQDEMEGNDKGKREKKEGGVDESCLRVWVSEKCTEKKYIYARTKRKVKKKKKGGTK